ncbi:response regulator transcription factor [Jeotgalicoccus huakuii]|nr:response regulator transcription factor [Jeotgalicoccus huakuii]
MTNKVLIVEDDNDILQLISLSLSSQNINNVYTATHLEEAKDLILKHNFQVLLLDLNLKSENGYQLMKFINLNMTKVIIVTAKDSEIDVYKGFQQGAIDYVKKPFDPIELAYRVKVHLKPVHHMKYKDLTVDTSTAEVFKADIKIHLTTREFDLLTCFMTNNNQILTKEQLYLNVWGYDKGVDDNTLMVHIRTLRKKIEDNPEQPELIQTVRGKGYIFRGDVHE